MKYNTLYPFYQIHISVDQFPCKYSYLFNFIKKKPDVLISDVGTKISEEELEQSILKFNESSCTIKAILITILIKC